MTFPSVDTQLEIIRRGVEKIVPEAELRPLLQKSFDSGVPLRVKYGIDPTGIDLHLGHTVPLRKMRQFQTLGHQAVIIIGNSTALVGDPSGRDETRARLTQQQVEQNAKDYLNQVAKVIDLSKAEVVHNGDWFLQMTFLELLELCSKVTVAQLLTRDDFSKRFQEETAIYLHECLYPLMQAWDSVKVRADIELGGTEQLYSFMLARDLQRDQKMNQQIGIMSPILVGTDGKKRMGKSLGNYIGISESPFEMMLKIMQLSDDCMTMYFELLTDLPLSKIEEILGGHPKEAKVTLAKQIIGEYHDTTAADNAAERWQKQVGQGNLPQEIPVVTLSRSKLKEGTLSAVELFYLLQLCGSKGEARRLIQQGGAKQGEEKIKIESYDQQIEVKSGQLFWAGKKKYCRVELTEN